MKQYLSLIKNEILKHLGHPIVHIKFPGPIILKGKNIEREKSCLGDNIELEGFEIIDNKLHGIDFGEFDYNVDREHKVIGNEC